MDGDCAELLAVVLRLPSSWEMALVTPWPPLGAGGEDTLWFQSQHLDLNIISLPMGSFVCFYNFFFKGSKPVFMAVLRFLWFKIA